MTPRFLSLTAVLPLFAIGSLPCPAAPSIGRYNVVWESPSTDQSGQMPIGNGDIAAGVCAIENGDLYLLLSKNDAFTYNGDLFKTGRVRISMNPNPFEAGKAFRQTLDLATGSIRIEADDVEIFVRADANRPVYHVHIQSERLIGVTAKPEFWKRIDGCKWNKSMEPVDPPTQDVCLERDGKILWYFDVGDRSVFPTEMEFYDVPEMVSKYPDPYRFNTFGNLLESPELGLVDHQLGGSGQHFDIHIHSHRDQSPDVQAWIDGIEKKAARPTKVLEDWEAHCNWWKEFWERSWITASDRTLPADQRGKLSGEGYTAKRGENDGGALVAQSYNVFRYLMACQSRGRIQTKFNGGLFTQPLRYNKTPRMQATKVADNTWISHEDDRLWGRRFTYQNQRLLYWPLLASGDFDMMQPFFDYYWDLLPVRKAITKAWFGHEGTYYRENIEPTGGERDCSKNGTDPETKPLKTPPGKNDGNGYYHSYYFTSGLETVAMMIDYVNFTGDTRFRDEVLAPFAREILLFFDKHYERDDNGKLRIDPGMVVETFWIAVNAAPDVSGLLFCLDELLAMEAGTADDKAAWRKFRAEIPEVHLHEIDGRKAIAPAREWAKKKNSENGELYPVFPFRLFGLGFGPESRDIVDWTMQHRTNPDRFGHKCWTQDQIHWAYAGNAFEAMDGLVHRFRNASPLCRFPLFGSEGPDSCPDFDHFGSGSVALQRMLVQEAAGKIHLLPAWPADWDADFKLHLSRNATISGKVVAGKLTDWNINPPARAGDVVVHQPQKIPERPLIPANDHPLRIGLDQADGNRFKGSIGRVTMFRGLLPDDAIRSLAGGDRAERIVRDSVIHCLLDPAAGSTMDIEPDQLVGELSFEAWIRPSQGENGRILDKLTPGKNNGFLLDCHPGMSLRFIADALLMTYPDTLKADTWQHLAITLSKHDVSLFLNGEKLRN